MNIISSNNSKNVVSLQELVPQHDCLKLLILHTPYTLVIDTLPLCINLVKLDLSKNNLESFPYLGDLSSLKFMFIHENKLDSIQLKNIFEKNGKKSSLSLNIVWVTFWGNKNSFLGRHYLVNETSVIAVDKNMVVQQQRTGELPSSNFEAFSHETDISEYLLKKNTINRHASEEEYMRELWIEMGQLRKKHEKLFPIIKIQKWFRGWRVREKKYQADQKLKQHSGVKSIFFSEWKQYVQRRILLKKILTKSKKEFLLLETKQMNKKYIEYRLVEIARNIKKKVISRKISLSSQMKFYNIVRQNFLLLKNIYQSLEVEKSTAVYVYKHSWDLFKKHIIPFLHIFEWSNISIKSNQQFSLHILHEFYSEKSKEFIKILQTNTKSTVFSLKTGNIDIKKMRRGKKALLFGSNLKNIYTGIPHFPTKRMIQIKGHMDNITAKDNYALEQLIKIEGQTKLLKDITRGIYFFNTKRLNLTEDLDKRIHFFSERMLMKITYAVKIQKVWRGYSFRKKNQQHLKIILKLQRAVIIIQRWARKISTNQKKIFMFYVAQRLNEIQQNIFYIEMSDYMKQLQERKDKKMKCAFLQQNIQLFLDEQTRNLVVSWDNKSQNFQVIDNILNGVPLFTKHFLSNKIGLSEELIKLKFIKDVALQKRCEFSHLFHYDAQSSIISRLGKKYLQVKCQSKLQAKFRAFVLMLMTYSIKNKTGLKIYTSKLFSNIDQANKIQVSKKDANFICNQNFNLIKSCELRFQKEVSVTLYVISNKFYLQNKDEKPIKAQEKFFIYLSNEVEVVSKKDVGRESVGTEGRMRYRTDVSYTSGGPFGQQHFLTEVMNETESNASQQNLQQQERLRQLMKKRSVKQFKIQKKAKNKKQQHPSFILDSISINDRLTTQPDYNVPNLSNRENNSVDHNADLLHVESSLSKPKIIYAQRKGTSIKKKQQEGFTKRFVNLANFIQNQYASDYRRRIKTEIENNAVESADSIRRSMERSHSHRNNELQEKHKKIREKHSQHKEIIEKVQVLTRERSLQLKNDVLEEREKKMKERAKLKRLKVSFAEECYPLASKTRKTEHFP